MLPRIVLTDVSLQGPQQCVDGKLEAPKNAATKPGTKTGSGVIFWWIQRFLFAILSFRRRDCEAGQLLFIAQVEKHTGLRYCAETERRGGWLHCHRAQPCLMMTAHSPTKRQRRSQKYHGLLTLQEGFDRGQSNFC